MFKILSADRGMSLKMTLGDKLRRVLNPYRRCQSSPRINKLRTQDSVPAPHRIEILAIDYLAASQLECHIYYTFRNLCRTTSMNGVLDDLLIVLWIKGAA